MNVLKTIDYALYWLSKPPPVDPPEKESKQSATASGDVVLSVSSEDEDDDGEDDDLGYLSALTESLSEMSLSEDVENWLTETGLYDLVSESFDRALPIDPDGGKGRRIIPRRDNTPFRDQQNDSLGDYARRDTSSALPTTKQNDERSPKTSNAKVSVFSSHDKANRKACSRETLSPGSPHALSPRYGEGAPNGHSFSPPPLKRSDSGVNASDDSESSSSLSVDMTTNNTPNYLEKALSDLDKALNEVYRGKYSSRKRKRRTTTPPHQLPPPKILSHSYSSEAFERDEKEINIPESISTKPTGNRRVTFSPSVEEKYAEKYGDSSSSSHSSSPVQPEPVDRNDQYLVCSCTASDAEENRQQAKTGWLGVRELLCSIKGPGISPEEEAEIRRQVEMMITEEPSKRHHAGPKGPEQIEIIHVEESFGEGNDFFRYGDPDGIVFVAPAHSTRTSQVPWWCRDEWISPKDGEIAPHPMVLNERKRSTEKQIHQHHVGKRLSSRTLPKDCNYVYDTEPCSVETKTHSSQPGSLNENRMQFDGDSCRPKEVFPAQRMENERLNASIRCSPPAERTELGVNEGVRLPGVITEPVYKGEIIDLCHCTGQARISSSSKGNTQASTLFPDGVKDKQGHSSELRFDRNKLIPKEKCGVDPIRPVTLNQTDPGAAHPPAPKRSTQSQTSVALQNAFDSVVENVSHEIDSVTREFKALAEKWDSMVLRGVGSLVGETLTKTSEVTQTQEKDRCLREKDGKTAGRQETMHQTHNLVKDASAFPGAKPRRRPQPRPESLLSSRPSPIQPSRVVRSTNDVIPRPRFHSPSNLRQQRPTFQQSRLSGSNAAASTYNANSIESKREGLLRRRARIQARLESRKSHQQSSKPGVYPEIRHDIGTKARIAARRGHSGLHGHCIGGRRPSFSTEPVKSTLSHEIASLRRNRLAGEHLPPSDISVHQHTRTARTGQLSRTTERAIIGLAKGRVDDEVIVVDSCSTSSSEVRKYPVQTQSLNHTAAQPIRSEEYGLPGCPIVVSAVSSHFTGHASPSFVEDFGATKLGTLKASVKHAKDNLATKMTALAVSTKQSKGDEESVIYARSADMANGSGVLLFKPTINVYGDASSSIEAMNSIAKGIHKGDLQTGKEGSPDVIAEVKNAQGVDRPATRRSVFDSRDVFSRDLKKRFEETDSVLSELLTLPRSPKEKRTKDIFDEEDGLEYELEQLAWSEKLLRDELESIQKKEAAIRWKVDAWNFHPSRVTPASRTHALRSTIDLSNVDDIILTETIDSVTGEQKSQKTIIGHRENQVQACILIPNLDHCQNGSQSEIGVELVHVEDRFHSTASSVDDSTDSFSLLTEARNTTSTFLPSVVGVDRLDHPSRTKQIDGSQASSQVSRAARESCSESSRSQTLLERTITNSAASPTLNIPSDDSDNTGLDPHHGNAVSVSHDESIQLRCTPSPIQLGDNPPWGEVELLYRERVDSKTARPPEGQDLKLHNEWPKKKQRNDFLPNSRSKTKVQDCRITSLSGSRSSSAKGSPWVSSSDEEINSYGSPPPNLYVAVETITVPCRLKKAPKRKSIAFNLQPGRIAFGHVSSSWDAEVASVLPTTELKRNISPEISFPTPKLGSTASFARGSPVESVTSNSCLESIASEEAERRLGIMHATKTRQTDIDKNPSPSIEETPATRFGTPPLHPSWELEKQNADRPIEPSQNSSVRTNDFTSVGSTASRSCVESFTSSETDERLRDMHSPAVSAMYPSGKEDRKRDSPSRSRELTTALATDLSLESGNNEAQELNGPGEATTVKREASRERGSSSARYSRLIEWHSKRRRIKASLQQEADHPNYQPRRSRRRGTHGIFANDKQTDPQWTSARVNSFEPQNNAPYAPKLLRPATTSARKSLKSSLPATARARHLASAVPGSLLWEAATDGDSKGAYK